MRRRMGEWENEKRNYREMTQVLKDLETKGLRLQDCKTARLQDCMTA
jgi:hypothetical protein